MSEDILKNMIEISLPKEDAFNIVRETLTRMGVKHKGENKLYQSAHILHKRGHFYICHFKEMFLLDGKTASLSESDIARRNTIADLLKEWNLITILNEEIMEEYIDMSEIKVVTYRDKNKWELIPKYTIGNRK